MLLREFLIDTRLIDPDNSAHMEASLSIKVTYGGITRRFRVDVDKNRNLDLDMNGLKALIFSLFDIPTGSDVSITYVDDGNDVVNLVDDIDLQEVMAQKLECLKITVLNNKRIDCLYSAACRSSTLHKHQTLPNQEDSARDASNKLALVESRSISRKGIEGGIKYLPIAAVVNSQSNANVDTPRKSGLSEEILHLLLQLQKENDYLQDKIEQLLRQMIEGKEVDIRDAPTARIIDSSWEPRLAEDNRQAQLQGEINALKGERELLHEKNKILKEIESNKAQLLKEIKALRNENEQLLRQNQNAAGSYGGRPDAQLDLNKSAAPFLLEDEPRGEEENGAPKMIMPPLNVSSGPNWIQAVVPSLGVLLTNLGIPVWLKTMMHWLLSLIVFLPWRLIFEKVYSFIKFVRNSISSSHQWLREKLHDVMVDLTRKMARSAGRPRLHSM